MNEQHIARGVLARLRSQPAENWYWDLSQLTEEELQILIDGGELPKEAESRLRRVWGVDPCLSLLSEVTEAELDAIIAGVPPLDQRTVDP